MHSIYIDALCSHSYLRTAKPFFKRFTPKTNTHTANTAHTSTLSSMHKYTDNSSATSHNDKYADIHSEYAHVIRLDGLDGMSQLEGIVGRKTPLEKKINIAFLLQKFFIQNALTNNSHRSKLVSVSRHILTKEKVTINFFPKINTLINSYLSHKENFSLLRKFFSSSLVLKTRTDLTASPLLIC
jgi:hypothetical protein